MVKIKNKQKQQIFLIRKMKKQKLKKNKELKNER